MEKLLQIAEQLGLDIIPTDAKRPNWICGNINGYKIEIEYRTKWELIVDYHEYGLAQQLKEHYDFFRPVRGARAFFNTPEELLTAGQEILSYIFDNDLHGEWQQKSRSLKTEDNGLFEKTASTIKAIVENEAWDFLNGRLTFFDAHDEVITIGKSKAVIGNPDAPQWREHIVPCVMIRDEAIRMVEAGNSVTEIAQMLKENLSIVIITASEAKWLDSMYQTTMPEGWNFGDSKFARLDAANIAY